MHQVEKFKYGKVVKFRNLLKYPKCWRFVSKKEKNNEKLNVNILSAQNAAAQEFRKINSYKTTATTTKFQPKTLVEA